MKKRYLFVSAIILLITAVIFQEKYWQSKELKNHRQPEESTKPISCMQLKIWTIAKKEWNNPIKLEAVEMQPPPPEAAQVRGIPGPKYYPVRPYIETSVSPGGLASTVVKGNEQTMPTAIFVSKTAKVIPLLESPGSLGARSDGVWSIRNQIISHYDTTGVLKQSVKIPGTEIVGVEKDAVWVMSLDEAWFVSASGKVRGPYPWKGFNSSVGSGIALCTLDGNSVRRIQCLEPDGKKYAVPIALHQPIKGTLLSFSKERVLTVGIAGALGYYSTRNVNADLTIENAGLTSTGDAFVSLNVDNKWADICISNGRYRRLSIKYKKPDLPFSIPFIHNSFPFPLRLNVVAVEGDRTLVYGFDRAVWYKGSRVEKTFVVDDNVYRKDIFPYHWRTATNFVTANSSDGTIIISTSGPTGMAIIGMRWNPESK
ncbi:MAG: hypothetical protein EAZ39_10735 [Oscillatoriales cyanobacterium]|uniref:hypothetical protein n=1 Tax=unclassified Microcoleus TaxID=2642155 RepID=UPI001D80AB95|nr:MULTISPECIES: hypothetical protein [unclassified Microcoleus]TAF91551.1 MAG: hypothetical protein EAZ49_04855 [Oscillatoriales cyanobacterium]MCC3436448.1 hypothetical protein [Microcoleus sp. PH2017_05_CCC_O_A]MCC3447607.1 hypothetical protein [Microcoleus sp. PH2017_09_SFU_O_A]MCC3584071.1 hypothetical protein [Microcoleus sp. PH2017_30_WIL_O_A]MCC3590637.1 hypothetical protein [Microcoleus sp. PH2017_28_MFU_U_A]